MALGMAVLITVCLYTTLVQTVIALKSSSDIHVPQGMNQMNEFSKCPIFCFVAKCLQKLRHSRHATYRAGLDSTLLL